MTGGLHQAKNVYCTKAVPLDCTSTGALGALVAFEKAQVPAQHALPQLTRVRIDQAQRRRFCRAWEE